MRKMTWLFVAQLLLATAAADGALITVEPDDFAPGTNISNAVPGVTLSVISTLPSFIGAPPDAFVYAKTNTIGGPAPTGTLVFATSASPGDFGSSWFSGDHVFRATFTAPTNFVSILTASDGADDTDFALFEIFDSSNTLLDSIQLLATNVAQAATFSRGVADIAYLIVRNPAGSPGDSFLLDRLQFESGETTSPVPEPSTMALMGMAFAGLGAARLRRRSTGGAV